MWEVFYGIIVCFVSSVIVYFYWCSNVFLIVLICSIFFLLFILETVTVEDFSKVFCKIKTFFISKLQYKELVHKNPGKKKTMSSFRKLSISGQNDCSFDSGLLSDYDSRRSRTSIKHNKSPGNKAFLNTSQDENYISKQSLSTTNNIFSPLRVSGSPLHCSPLSHSKRYNVNVEKDRSSTSRRSSSRRSLLLEDSMSLGSPKSSTNKDFQTMSFSPASTILEKTSSPANRMNVAQFPWISSTGPMIPLIQSPLQSSSSSFIGSPQRDSSSNTPKSNRVRVRLTCPSRSDLSITSHDVSSTPDDSCTTKSVIQVLKEISRKRAFMASEEDVEHEAKRRPEHNLYMSCFEREESNSISTRTNVVDDDRKRTREPDWDTGNITGPKRRRKNNHIVNNEILSSLSSSIGLRQFHASPVIEKPPKQTVSIGTQVSLMKDSSDKKQNEQSAQTNALKPTKEVKEASTMPDPPPPPRQRSPVKEKVVTDLNGILKSALSKFKIQPKESTNNEAPSFPAKSGDISAGITTKASDLPNAQSAILPTSLTSPSTQTLPLGTQPSFSPQASNFKLPASTTSNQPQTLFGSPMSSPSNAPKENKTTEERVIKPDVQNANNNLESLNKKDETKSELTGFKISNPVETPNNVSPFKFGQLPNSTPQTTQSSVPTSTPFSFKAQEASSTVGTSDTPRPTFSFGSPKTESTVANSTSGPTANTQFASAQVSQANSTVAQTTGNEPFKFGTSTFALKEKSSDKNELSKDEKKEAGNVALFSFGKTESKTGVDSDKTVSVNKPFQFGSGGFTFGQTSSQNKETSSPFTQNTTTTSSTTTDVAKPVFTFSSNSEKKDEKPGGFSFQLPTCTASVTSEKQNPVFSFSGTQNTAAATTVSSIVSTTSTSNPKPIFPPSLFGSTNTSTAASNSTAVTSKSTQAVPVASSASSPFTSASTFGSTVTEANKTISTTTTTMATSTFASVASTFGSGNKTIFGSTPSSGANTTSPFGTNNASNNQPVSTSIFGSNMSTNAAVFSSTNNKTSTFGAPTTTSSGLTTTFGAPTTTSSVLTPTFGATTTTSSVPTFGSAVNPNTTSFGNPTTTTAPTFGSTGSLSASTSGFGSNTVPAGSSAPTFGSGLATTTAPTFGVSSTSTPTFGSVQTKSAPLFGSTTATGTTPAFGSGSGNNAITFGSNTTTGSVSTPFGGSTSTPTFGSTATPAFGGSTTTPAFGGSTTTPAFGGSTTTPAFGGNNTTPAFGGSNTTAVFGGSTSSAPAFGSQPQSFGNQTGTTFGGTPAFGQNTSSPSPFGAQSTFGSQTTTPAFGATPAFGSSSSTFSAAPSATAAPAFGSSAPTFGSPATFGAQDANKPFTFNAPSNQQQATGGFNFTAPQQPQNPSSGLFQFGASSNTQPSQPFQFNAAQPSSAVGGTGQQMFSIGSGSTAPRRVTARRKK